MINPQAAEAGGGEGGSLPSYQCSWKEICLGSLVPIEYICHSTNQINTSTLESCCPDMNDLIPWISPYHLIHSEAQVHCMRHLDFNPLGTHTPEQTQRVSYVKYEKFPRYPSKHSREEQVLHVCTAPRFAIKKLPRLLSACLQVGIRENRHTFALKSLWDPPNST